MISALALTTGLAVAQVTTADAVVRAAEPALLLDDGDSEVLGYAGCALSDLGQRERGAEILQQALAIDPSNAQAHVALGTTRALQGQWAIGIETLRHGMRISPRDRRLGFWGWALAQFLLRSDQPEEALQAAQTSTGLDAKLHLLRIIEAAALHTLGLADEARMALATARRLRPGLTLAKVELVHGRRVARQTRSLWPTGELPTA